MNIQSYSVLLIGILLLALVTVESGGVFLTRVATGGVPASDTQRNFYRAGHAHAAVLLVLSMVIASAIGLAGLDSWLAVVTVHLVPIAALLMPAGFFLSVLGRHRDRPGPLVALLWIGAASLTVGLVLAGVQLVVAGLALA